MKRISKKAALILAITILFSSNTVTFAAANHDLGNGYSTSIKSANEGINSTSRVLSSSTNKCISSYMETLIYSGKGSDRWLHITPWTTPNRFTIRMVDYQGNTVWRQSFDTTGGTTHWFVGANVKRVYLTGIPGGVVDVTDTEH